MDRKIIIAGGGAGAAIVALVLIIAFWPGKADKTAAPSANVDSAETVAAAPKSDAGEADIKINLLPLGPDDRSKTPEISPLDTFTGEIMTVSARPMLFISGEVNVIDGSPNAVIQVAHAKIRAFIAAHGLVAEEPPFAITEGFDQATNVWRFKAGIALTAAPAAPPSAADGIKLGSTYAGAVARFVHIGDPNQAQTTYAKIDEWLKANGLAGREPTWEEYTFDPATPVSQWHTNICIPVG